MLWVVSPRLSADQPIAIGGAGFAGLILLLHFGLFHLLALAWRRKGVARSADPCVFRFWPRRLPISGASRWNRAYRRVSFDFFFHPAVIRFGTVVGTLLAFIVSGLFHELVISFPSHGGYGGPTAYFVIQGLGLLLERRAFCRGLMQRQPLLGWLYTLTFVLGPIGLLFPAPFLTHVIVPFLEMMRCIN